LLVGKGESIFAVNDSLKTSGHELPTYYQKEAFMNTRFFFISCLCVLFVFSVYTSYGQQSKKEKDMLDKAHEMTYEGQIEHAQKLLSEGEKDSGKTGSKKADADDGSSLFLSMLWGAFGTGYFLYGKRVPDAIFLLCGIGLMVMPLFVGDFMTSLIAGLIMLLLPFKDRFLQSA